jgi:hypothetical protein
MSHDRIERWKHLETSLSSLLSSIASQLDPSSRETVTEFIENREYAIALEWLAEAASKQGISFGKRNRRSLIASRNSWVST